MVWNTEVPQTAKKDKAMGSAYRIQHIKYSIHNEAIVVKVRYLQLHFSC